MEPNNLTGGVFGVGGEKSPPLYQYKRSASVSNQTVTVVWDYMYPDGKLAARERVKYDAGGLLSYGLSQTQTGEEGLATVRRDARNPGKSRIDFEYRKAPGADPKRSTERLQPNTLVGDMVGSFLGAHWDELMQGQTLKTRYIVLDRAETVGFSFSKASETTFDSKPAVIIKMEATSPIIAALVDPLYFTIEKATTHRVLQYTGRTKWKDLDAVNVNHL
jgi:hypothetical protein